MKYASIRAVAAFGHVTGPIERRKNAWSSEKQLKMATFSRPRKEVSAGLSDVFPLRCCESNWAKTGQMLI